MYLCKWLTLSLKVCADVPQADIDADLSIVKKSRFAPVWDDGIPCWRNGNFGYLKNRACSLLDIDAHIAINAKRALLGNLVDGTPCWYDRRFGYIRQNTCNLVDLGLDLDLGLDRLGLKKRLLGGGNGLLGSANGLVGGGNGVLGGAGNGVLGGAGNGVLGGLGGVTGSRPYQFAKAHPGAAYKSGLLGGDVVDGLLKRTTEERQLDGLDGLGLDSLTGGLGQTVSRLLSISKPDADFLSSSHKCQP